MKKKYALLFAMMLILSACGNKEDNSTQGSSNVEKSAEDMNKDEVKNLQEAGEKMASEVGKLTSDELKSATPLTNEQLKELLPDKINGMERKKFSVGQLGMHIVDASYEDGDKTISLSILDGAGEAGSAMIGMMQMGISAGAETEDENGYMKPIEIDGEKGVEKQEKFNGGEKVENSITLIVSERFMLTVTGNGKDVDELRKVINKHNLIDKLKDLK
ncbi:MAG: hypothetical protein FNT15_08200 [Sulfurovum sp.]|nr:MAG: hypothetical protein FNT15_08200 [Sulfurovum sp.]